MKFRKENPDSKIKCTFKTSAYPLVDKALKLWFYQIRNDNVQINYDTVACQAMVFQKDLYTCTINFIYNKVLEKQKHVIRKIYHPKDF